MGHRRGEVFVIEGSDEERRRERYRVRPLGKTSVGLRDTLFEAMDALRRGEIEAYEARGMASLAHAICKTVQLEIEVEKLRSGIIDEGRHNPIPLQLGSDGNDNEK